MLTTTTSFSTTSPLPATVSRDSVLQILHNHPQLIQLNPLVTKLEPCVPPPNSPPEELERDWYEITDKIDYVPFASVSYKASFEDTEDGTMTHTYAPMGLGVKGTWTVGKYESEEGESNGGGLYLKEDVEMTCNVLLRPFVQSMVKAVHGKLVERLIEKAAAGDNSESTQH